MKKNKEKIGQRIKAIRLSLGMTTKDFGALLGATDSNVSSWEKGRTSPNPERLRNIAKLGNMTVDEILYGNLGEYLTFLLHGLSDKLMNDDSIPDMLAKNIFSNIRSKYYQSNREITEHFANINSFEELERDFKESSEKAIFLAKNGQYRDEAIYKEFKSDIEKALYYFLDYYMYPDFNEEYPLNPDVPFMLNYTVPEGMNEEFKNEVEKATYKFLDELEEIFNKCN